MNFCGLFRLLLKIMDDFHSKIYTNINNEYQIYKNEKTVLLYLVQNFSEYIIKYNTTNNFREYYENFTPYEQKSISIMDLENIYKSLITFITRHFEQKLKNPLDLYNNINSRFRGSLVEYLKKITKLVNHGLISSYLFIYFSYLSLNEFKDNFKEIDFTYIQDFNFVDINGNNFLSINQHFYNFYDDILKNKYPQTNLLYPSEELNIHIQKFREFENVFKHYLYIKDIFDICKKLFNITIKKLKSFAELFKMNNITLVVSQYEELSIINYAFSSIINKNIDIPDIKLEVTSVDESIYNNIKNIYGEQFYGVKNAELDDILTILIFNHILISKSKRYNNVLPIIYSKDEYKSLYPLSIIDIGTNFKINYIESHNISVYDYSEYINFKPSQTIISYYIPMNSLIIYDPSEDLIKIKYCYQNFCNKKLYSSSDSPNFSNMEMEYNNLKLFVILKKQNNIIHLYFKIKVFNNIEFINYEKLFLELLIYITNYDILKGTNLFNDNYIFENKENFNMKIQNIKFRQKTPKKIPFRLLTNDDIINHERYDHVSNNISLFNY